MESEWRPRRLAYPSGVPPSLHDSAWEHLRKSNNPRGVPRLNGRHVLRGHLG